MSKVFGCVLALNLGLTVAGAIAQSPADKQFSPEQVTKGAGIYAQHCATCHGERMANPPWAIDLATFPRDQRARFVDSVTYGVRNMPPWGDVIKPEEVAALWAYLVAGERKN